MFERKMKSKEVRVSKTQANSIGLDPTTIYSSDEGLKSLNTQQRSIVHSVIFGGENTSDGDGVFLIYSLQLLVSFTAAALHYPIGRSQRLLHGACRNRQE